MVKVRQRQLFSFDRSSSLFISLIPLPEMAAAERDKVIDSFRSGKTRVLVTTNVLARGVDVLQVHPRDLSSHFFPSSHLQVSLVVNFDIPTDSSGRPEPETYLHRIGRSARYGHSGLAINLVHDAKSRADLLHISQHFQKKIDAMPVDKLEMIGPMLDKIA